MEGHERKFSGKSYVILFRMAVSVLFLVGLLPLPVLAGPAPGESEVKAVFVLNFIKFVEWPASAFLSPEDPIVLSLLGNDPTEAVLASLGGMKASGRRVVVRKVPSLSALGRCHVLYVGRSVKKELPAILAVVQRRPVLTIADFEEFPGRGGTIGIIRQDDRVGFEINEEAARKAGLKVNAKLLYLGKRTRALQGGER